MEDSVGYPKLAAFRAGTSTTVDVAKKFDWIVGDGYSGGISFLDKVYAANPKQLQMVQPWCFGGGLAYEETLAATYGFGKIISPVPSPWGTLRASDKINDNLKNPDGTVHQAGTTSVLDWQQYIGDASVAIWSARMRAKYYLDDLAGAHPNIKGLWGDNDFWSDNGYAWTGVNINLTKWDDGFIVHHKEMQRVLPPGTLIGGNDLASMADHPASFHGSDPVGWKLLGGGGQCGMKEGVNHYRNIMNPAGAQSVIEGVRRWLALSSEDGQQRYIMVSVNTVATTSPTARVGLAIACLSGAYYWLYTGSGGDFGSTWTSWMPEFDKYGKNWLGKGIDDPVQISTGLWVRHFENGTVILNLSGTFKTVEGITVSNGDAAFTQVANPVPTPTPTPTPPPPSTDVTVDQSIKNGATLTGTIHWTAIPSVSVTAIEFWHDGVRDAVVPTAPYAYELDTTKLSNGTHKLGLTVVKTDGTKVWTPFQLDVTINNTVTPPPPPPPTPTPIPVAEIAGLLMEATTALNDAITSLSSCVSKIQQATDLLNS